MFNRVPELEKAVLGPAPMGEGYWAVSSSNVTDEMWKENIKNQQPPEPDDDSDVV